MNVSFRRKIIYGAAIVALLIPLFFLGQPATKSAVASRNSPGGKLSQLRSSYGLAQAELGKIDPASETMKMATLGLRGIATNLLWQKAQHYKKTENWDQLSATLNQIAKLQPNYLTVWEFQAHNLSYNVSVEFDNYRHRYHWVKKGIAFLMEGTEYNQHSPRLYWNLGWFCSQKIGRSDEHEQFRRMFKVDDDFHLALDNHGIRIDDARGPEGYPDNWLVGHLWYLESQKVVTEGIPTTWVREDPDQEGLTDKRRSAIIFYSDAALALVNHANAIQDEIAPGEKTRSAWKRAADALDDLGNRDVPTSFGHAIKLNDLPVVFREIQDLKAQLDAISPGLREKMRAERMAALSPEELAAFEKSENPRLMMNPQEMDLAQMAHFKLNVSDDEVAAAVPDEGRKRALRLTLQIGEKAELLDRIASYRNLVNYAYWTARCQMEQEPDAAEARLYLQQASQLLRDSDPEGAEKKFEMAWQLWSKIFQKYPALALDMQEDDLEEFVLEYRDTLNQLDKDFPENFLLPPGVEPPAGVEGEPGTETQPAGELPKTGDDKTGDDEGSKTGDDKTGGDNGR